MGPQNDKKLSTWFVNDPYTHVKRSTFEESIILDMHGYPYSCVNGPLFVVRNFGPAQVHFQWVNIFGPSHISLYACRPTHISIFQRVKWSTFKMIINFGHLR